MRKILFALVLSLFGWAASPMRAAADAPAATAPDPSNGKRFELSCNVFGLFVGNYTARLEMGIPEDGFIAAGLKGTFNKGRVADWDLSYTGAQGLVDVRLYPGKNLSGFYLMVEGGYSRLTLSATDTFDFETIPFMAGLGWKWTIDRFGIDLGAAYGSRIVLRQPQVKGFDPNQFPWNAALDAYLLCGFRF